MAIVAVVLGIALVSADTFINAVGVLRTFVTQYCSWWIVLCAFLCFAVCIFVAVTKLGSIRLGGKDAKPAFSYFSWFAMLFATGQGVGLVFWAVAEPIMMYGGTPFNAPDPLFAGDTALAWTYFHWAIPRGPSTPSSRFSWLTPATTCTRTPRSAARWRICSPPARSGP